MSEYKNHEDPFIAAAQKVVDADKTGDVTPPVVPVEPEVPVPPAAEKIENVVPDTTEEVETPEVEVPVETHVETEPINEDVTPPEETTSTEDVLEVGNFDNWDVTSTEEAAPTGEVDYSELAKQVGVDATNQAEFISKVKELKTATEVAPPDPFAGLPDNLKKAVEIAKLDGNYLEYLGVTSVDYNQVDPAQLVQNQYAQLLTDANGAVDTEKLAEVMEGMTDTEIEMQGRKIAQEMTARQTQFTQNVTLEAQEAKLNADRELKRALDDLTEVRGFKLNATHKQKLYQDVSSGKMIQDLFYTDGKMDYNKIVRIVFEQQKGEAMHNHLKQQITVKTKKEMLTTMSNKTTPTKQGERPHVASKPKTAQESVGDFLREGGNVRN